MTDVLFTGYELWDLSPRPQPPVTRLFPLLPCGLGTSAVESLSSYVVRLAQAHRVRVHTLVARVLRPYLGSILGHLPYTAQLASFWLRDAASINGLSGLSQAWVEALGQLTGVGGLAGLTMLGWVKVVAPRALMRSTRAWCPDCYAEAREGKVYDRLLWALACVNVCEEHQRVLEHCCPVCGRTQRMVGPHSRPGCCSWCGAWLGQQERKGEVAQPRELWVVQSVGELVAHGATEEERPGRAQIQQVIKALVARMPWRRPCRLAQLLNTTGSAVSAWNSGRSLPQLDSLLRVSACTKLSPYQLLTDVDIATRLRTIRLGSIDTPPTKRRRVYQRYNPVALQAALQEELESPTSPPASVRAVAQQLSTSESQLRLHAPEQCRAISARYRAYWAQRSAQRLADLTEAIRAAVVQLHQEGIHPCRVKVAERVGRPGMMRDPKVRAAWLQAVSDLEGVADTPRRRPRTS
jgi:hypothetical protein